MTSISQYWHKWSEMVTNSAKSVLDIVVCLSLLVDNTHGHICVSGGMLQTLFLFSVALDGLSHQQSVSIPMVLPLPHVDAAILRNVCEVHRILRSRSLLRSGRQSRLSHSSFPGCVAAETSISVPVQCRRMQHRPGTVSGSVGVGDPWRPVAAVAVAVAVAVAAVVAVAVVVVAAVSSRSSSSSTPEHPFCFALLLFYNAKDVAE